LCHVPTTPFATPRRGVQTHQDAIAVHHPKHRLPRHIDIFLAIVGHDKAIAVLMPLHHPDEGVLALGECVVRATHTYQAATRHQITDVAPEGRTLPGRDMEMLEQMLHGALLACCVLKKLQNALVAWQCHSE
jgi:hypothetical protein